MEKKIYLDHAATTYMRQEAIEKMFPYLNEIYGNASSIHSWGREARRILLQSRESIAEIFSVNSNEVFFTSGGTEADNWAIKGVVDSNTKKGKHIITTQIEHHAVLHACQELERKGFDITYLPVDSFGFVNEETLKKSLRPDTILVSIIYANNEIGTIQPIDKLAKIVKENSNAIFHTDAVQAVGALPINLGESQDIDLLSFTAHKFYGPKGVGGLFIRRGTQISNLIDGGAQEYKRRAGTENIPGIVGMTEAIMIAHKEMHEESKRLTSLRDALINGVMNQIDSVILNGHPEKRLPNNVNLCFKYIEGEALLLSLDAHGIAGSSGSACTSGSLDPSHVLLAIGLPHEIAHGSLRLTLGKSTTEKDIVLTIEVLKKVVHQLRLMSPLYEQNDGGKINV